MGGFGWCIRKIGEIFADPMLFTPDRGYV